MKLSGKIDRVQLHRKEIAYENLLKFKGFELSQIQYAVFFCQLAKKTSEKHPAHFY